jgi:REP element-mobilizing transposase RayT
MNDIGVHPHDDPLGYLLTWTTYGTWLPGDERWWVKESEGFQKPDFRISHEARRKLKEEPCLLMVEERSLVEATITRHCEIRGWHLHAVNCRTNHVHVVVTAPKAPSTVMEQFKAWATRKLKERQRLVLKLPEGNIRLNWWTEDGSKRYLNGQVRLDNAILYVRDGQ